MAAPNTSAASLGWKLEPTVGTTGTPDLFLPFTSESLSRTDALLESDGIRADRLIMDDEESNGGLIEVGGSFEGDLPVKGATSLFKHMFGAVNTTGSNPYTHVFTPSATVLGATVQVALPDASGTKQPKTITGAVCESWEIAGAEGQIVTFSDSVVGTRLQVGSRTITNGETTDTSSTLGGTFTQADVGKDVSGTGIPAGAWITAVASDGNSATMSAPATATDTGVSVVVGKALAAASYPSSLSYYKMHEATLAIGGSAVPLKGFTVGGAIPTQRNYYGGSRFSAAPSRTGELWDITGTLNLDYLSNAQLDRYFAGEFFAVSIVLAKGANSITFALNGRYSESLVPQVDGRGRLAQDAPFIARGSSDANACTVTMINSDTSA